MNASATRDYLGVIKRVVTRRPNPLLVDRGIDFGDGLVAIVRPDELRTSVPVQLGMSGSCQCCDNWQLHLELVQIGQVDYRLCTSCKDRHT